MEPNSILDQFRKAVDIGNWEAIQGLGNFILTSPDSLDKEAVIERSLIEFQQCLDND